MTKPKPTQWELIHNTKTATYLQRREGDIYHEARFIGPDRQASARKFIHMDELVEAAEAARLFIEDQYRCQESQALQGEFLAKEARPVHRALCNILAKIDGGG